MLFHVSGHEYTAMSLYKVKKKNVKSRIYLLMLGISTDCSHGRSARENIFYGLSLNHMFS